MANKTEPPRTKLIIKLYLPLCDKKRGPASEEKFPHSHAEKKRKVNHETACNNTSHSHSYSAIEEKRTVQEKLRVVAKDSSRTKKNVSDSCDVITKKVDGEVSALTTLKSTTTSFKGEMKLKSFGVEKENSSRISRNGLMKNEECNNKKEKKKVFDSCDKRTEKVDNEVSEMTTISKGHELKYPTKSFGTVKENSSTACSRKGFEERNNKQKNTKQKILLMDRCKKMQCWVMLKRLMVGRDGWALKQPLLDLKDLDILDNSKAIIPKPKGTLEGNVVDKCNLKKPMSLEEIESKLKKLEYSEPDGFANDIRLVFSYALQYPRKSEVHRVARRLSESFELSWKSLKEKWVLEEERQRKKICKREKVCPKDYEKEVTTKGRFEGLRDSHCYADAKRSLQKNNMVDLGEGYQRKQKEKDAHHMHQCFGHSSSKHF